MGGNALKTPTRRLSKDEYTKVELAMYKASYCHSGSRLHAPLLDFFETFTVIPSYRNKESFGDMDILCIPRENLDFDQLKKTLTEAYGATEFFHNGPVFSFDYHKSEYGPKLEGEGFQVDLVMVRRSHAEFSLNYYAYNDLGNLIGRVAKGMGLKFGHNGLWCKCQIGDYGFRAVKVTDDFYSAIEFLGFDSETHLWGFDDLEDIFEYVAESKYFNPDLYLLENVNAVSRIRDKKRKTYMEFLGWCRERPDLPKYPYHHGDTSIWLPKLMAAFPDFEEEYRRAVTDMHFLQSTKKKLSGHTVAKLTGLADKALGDFLKEFKASFGPTILYQTFVIHNSEEDIAKAVLDFHSKRENHGEEKEAEV